MKTALLAVLLSALPANAVVVDRVAIAVGNKVITESEIELRIRLTAYQNSEIPDLSLASRRQAASRLIDQKLIEREMEVGHYPNLPEVRAKELLMEYLTQNYDGDAAAMVIELTQYALLPGDIQEDLARQADLLTFLNLRFRPAVQVSDQEARKSFDEKATAAGTAQDEQTYGSLRASIERQLTTEKADKELDIWLEDQEKRTRIVFVEKELAADTKGSPAP